MKWKHRYRLRAFLTSSIWPVPVAAIVLGMFGVLPAVRWLDSVTGWTLPAHIEGARAVAGTIIGSLLSFIVIVFSTLLLTVQVAASQITPRIVYRVFADNVTKFSLGFFVIVYTVALGTLARLTDPVPMFGGLIAGYGSLLCLAVFIFLIDWVGGQLRLSRAIMSIVHDGERVIHSVYPRLLDMSLGSDAPPEPLLSGEPTRVVYYSGGPGILQAFDAKGLTNEAERAGVVIDLAPQIGRFVVQGDVLFRVYGPADAVQEAVLHNSVAFGSERTMSQDPAFVIRVIVDIACKALSPGINDPSTAVLAIDQIHYLLGLLGERDLDIEAIWDSRDELRLIYRTPEWEDYVLLAVTEIRQFGVESVQVARRLKAMLNDLIETMPPTRRKLLKRELTILNRQVKRSYDDPTDQARAGTGDAQGVGGAETD